MAPEQLKPVRTGEDADPPMTPQEYGAPRAPRRPGSGVGLQYELWERCGSRDAPRKAHVAGTIVNPPSPGGTKRQGSSFCADQDNV